ncbi:hypothetical protein E4U43_004856 [Claviceps pusilla]|uniref:Uncharacterized protein n=1 Tax=Claviceps pusilla TaxID=123648 RepID=A0A9P7N2T3_9HYPO|nr:hypothetical protein E4U43_004856 [Claviceps pusilla]
MCGTAGGRRERTGGYRRNLEIIDGNIMGQTRKCCVAVRALRPLDHSACRESCCLPISDAEKGYLLTWDFRPSRPAFVPQGYNTGADGADGTDGTHDNNDQNDRQKWREKGYTPRRTQPRPVTNMPSLSRSIVILVPITAKKRKPHCLLLLLPARSVTQGQEQQFRPPPRRLS